MWTLMKTAGGRATIKTIKQSQVSVAPMPRGAAPSTARISELGELDRQIAELTDRLATFNLLV
jgi:hypothetical protein